jgi:hypothetical protein
VHACLHTCVCLSVSHPLIISNLLLDLDECFCGHNVIEGDPLSLLLIQYLQPFQNCWGPESDLDAIPAPFSVA